MEINNKNFLKRLLLKSKTHEQFDDLIIDYLGQDIIENKIDLLYSLFDIAIIHRTEDKTEDKDVLYHDYAAMIYTIINHGTV